MHKPNEYTTVLKTSDSMYVEMVASLLKSEGISVQHPGLHHSALVTGMPYIQIELRVRNEDLERARKLISAFTEPYVESGTKLTFIVRQNKQRIGGLLGMLFGLFVSVLFSKVGMPLNGLAILGIFVAATIGGAIVGTYKVNEVCSIPGCGGKIDKSKSACSRCQAVVAGSIQSRDDHFEALERFKKKS